MTQDPFEVPWRSRLTSDPKTGGVAIAIACALHFALVFILIPHEIRRESREDTARRFGHRGPANEERLIRVRLLPSGDPVRGAPATLMGAVAPEVVRRFEGKLAPVVAVPRREKPGATGTNRVVSLGDDPVARLRALHGDHPTVQSEDVVVRAVVKPQYPQQAIDDGIEGVVVVVAFVNTLGEVEDVALEKGVARALDQEAVRAAYKTLFEPYLPRGRLQPVFVRIRYNFELISMLPG
ncbi:MAG: TonB family protein [Candidatus Eisenbacteria bacterium]